MQEMQAQVEQFSKGDRVMYRATGEYGIVSSMNSSYVFVKFVVNGVLQNTANACSREALIKS